MKLDILKLKTIQNLREDFNQRYPFLKLEFYKVANIIHSVGTKDHLSHSTLLRSAGLKKEGHIEINDDITVGELERIFLEQFGLAAQVSRNSGGIWLETTMTDTWTLRKQNDYGKEIVKRTKQDFTNSEQIDN
jgi:hypothetical protein